MQIASAPLVSVVIPTKNEEKNIGNCLASIKGQTYKNVEIIVVDNFSSDRTQEIAKEYTQHVYSKGPERCTQRNFGMLEVATGDYVMYIDADMILSPNVIDACVRRMAKGDCLALQIRELVLGKEFWSRVRCFERTFYDGTVVDGARIFLRKAFAEVGGFDEEVFRRGSVEDWDIDKMIKRIGKIELLQDAGDEVQSWDAQLAEYVESRGIQPSLREPIIYHNEAEFDMVRYLKKKIYYSKCVDGYINKWGKNDPDVKKQLGLWYRYFVVFTENGKWKKLLASPVLAVAMYALRVLVGIFFICRFMLKDNVGYNKVQTEHIYKHTK